jgi:hypothetical protein
MKNKETLEEAADIDSKNHYKDQSDYWAIGFDSFKRGAKWQAKRSYSEEEVLKIVTSCKEYLSFGDEFDEKEWFEQYKKK